MAAYLFVGYIDICWILLNKLFQSHLFSPAQFTDRYVFHHLRWRADIPLFDDKNEKTFYKFIVSFFSLGLVWLETGHKKWSVKNILCPPSCLLPCVTFLNFLVFLWPLNFFVFKGNEVRNHAPLGVNVPITTLLNIEMYV